MVQAASDLVWYLPLDLDSFESIRECAAAFVATGKPLHVLLNNAGIMGIESVGLPPPPLPSHPV